PFAAAVAGGSVVIMGPSRLGWRGVGCCMAAFTLLAGASACSSSNPPSSATSVSTGGQPTSAASPTTAAPSTDPAVTEPTAGNSSPDTTVVSPPADLTLLTDAGIVVGADEASVTAADGAFRMLDVQARRLVADLMPVDGMLGADLDALAPMPAGLPPISFLLAAWISMGATTTALAAQGVMGEQDWQNAPQVSFPVAVVSMFVADIAAQFAGGTPLASPADVPPTDEGAGSGQPATTVTATSAPGAQGFRAPAAAGGPCTAVTQFLTSVIGGLFDALRVSPPASGSNILVSLFNGAITLAQALVQGLVDLALEPFLAAIRIGIGALGVVTTIVSLFKNESLTVTLEPGQGPNYRFGIDGETPPGGMFVARSREMTADWPTIVTDCAAAAGATLPALIPPGAPAHWTVTNPFGIIQPGALDTTVDQDKTARLSFVTGSESLEQSAKGTELNGRAAVEVRVPRKEIDAFLQIAKDQVASAEQALLAKVPAGPGRAAAQAAVRAAIDPTVNALSDQVSAEVGGVFALMGHGSVFVKHHAPPETTTTVIQGLEVTFDRPAIYPLDAGRVVDLISCTGVFGEWHGVIRNGGINGGGVSIPFQDIPISFMFDGPDDPMTTTHSESDLATYRGPVHVVLDLVITIDDSIADDTTMSITGTGAASNGEIGISDLLGSVASDLPIGPAPDGSC
ncbi:MAG: hypothetical protein JWN62_3920, partial [Acidimicrobiales bacterium]|nr:hypothetical protein [Acidimicrobiales bacterium]